MGMGCRVRHVNRTGNKPFVHDLAPVLSERNEWTGHERIRFLKKCSRTGWGIAGKRLLYYSTLKILRAPLIHSRS